MAQTCHPPPCPQWEPGLRGVPGDPKVTTVSRQPPAAAPGGVPGVPGWRYPWALQGILSPRVLPCPQERDMDPPFPPSPLPVPGTPIYPEAVPLPLPLYPCAPQAQDMSPCGPSMSPFRALPLARRVPLPGLFSCPGCPPSQDVPFPGTSPFPGIPPLQASPSARGVPFPGFIPCTGCPLFRASPLSRHVPLPGMSLCSGCRLSQGVPLPGMSRCRACPFSTAVPLPL